MISSTNLSLIPGAELIEHNGERGIFIPTTVLHLSTVASKVQYNLLCRVSPYRPKKNKPNSGNTIAAGRLWYPDWSKDKRLASPTYMERDPLVQWISNPSFVMRGVKGSLDDSFLTDILDR